MDDSSRKLEIEDRLAEMELGLPGLLTRNDRAALYLERELNDLLQECRTESDAWTVLSTRAEALLARVEAASEANPRP
ncbi:MAG: hypothetical protein ACYC33_06195 [Thermoleophilia bacterium]